MPVWNPDAPDIFGDEWYGLNNKAAPITTAAGIGLVVAGTVGESITGLTTMLRAPTKGQGAIVADVYDLTANPNIVQTQETVIALPVANAHNVGGWFEYTAGGLTQVGYSTRAWDKLDEVVSDGSDINLPTTDGIVLNPGAPQGSPVTALFYAAASAGTPVVGSPTFYHGADGSAGATVASKRCCYLRVVCIAYSGSAHTTMFDGMLYMKDGNGHYNSFTSDSGPQPIRGRQNPTKVVFTFTKNPMTNQPWNQADVAALTDGATHGFGIVVNSKTNDGGFFLASCELQFTLCPEIRLATGFGFSYSEPGNPTDNWSHVTSLSPADFSTAAWAKQVGHTYFVCLSSLRAPNASMLFLGQENVIGARLAQVPGISLMSIPMGPGLGVPTGVAVPDNSQPPLLLMVSGVASVDSAPYVAATDIKVGADGQPKVAQEFSTETAQSYGSAVVVLAVDSDGKGGTKQDQPITATLKAQAGNTVLAGPVTIHPSDIPATGKYFTVAFPFATTALTNGQAVYLELASTSSKSWRVPVLMHRAPANLRSDAFNAVAAAVGIGGTPDNAVINGVASADSDFPWSIGAHLNAPTGLAVTPLTVANQPALAHIPGPAGSGVGTTPSLVAYAHVTWTATSHGASFGAYELQRAGPDNVFSTIALITKESSNYFNDVGGPRGQAAANVARSYRIRYVRIDGSVSDWSGSVATHLEVQDCADFVLSSNGNVHLALAFNDLGGIHSWDQLQTQRGKIQPILGRKDPVAFYPLDEGGEQFTRKLFVAGNDFAIRDGGPVTPDRAVFSPVLNLLQDRTQPCIEYADAWGNVWYTSPAVVSPGPTRQERGGIYTIDVQFTSISDVPVPVAVDVPGVLP